MKTFNTLIKLAKRKLDELRKAQGVLERQKEQLINARMNLHKELEREMNIAAKQLEMAGFFGGFAKRIKIREDELMAEVKKIEAEIEKIAEEIMLAYTDLKKYEIAKDNAMKRRAEEMTRKETIMLDEIASQQYGRKLKEGQ